MNWFRYSTDLVEQLLIDSDIQRDLVEQLWIDSDIQLDLVEQL